MQLLALTLFQYSTATVVGNRTANPVNACETMLNIVSGGSYARIRPITAKIMIKILPICFSFSSFMSVI